MEIVIAGCGKVGSSLAKILGATEHNITVIDTNEAVINSITTDSDVGGIGGSCLVTADLSDANIERTNIFIATTGSDEVNLLSCIIAKKLGAKHTIARVRNPEIAAQSSFMRNDLGISMMINPDQIAAAEIAKMLRYPAAINIETFSKGQVEMAEIRIHESSVLRDTALFELSKKLKLDVLICAVQRGEELLTPRGNFILQLGDKIHVTASHSEMVKFLKTISETYRERRIKSAVLIGGGRTSYHLAKQLIDTSVKVKIIERDPERCNELSENLNKVDISCADGTDYDILQEERVFDADAVIAMTGIDEENMLLSLLARKNGVKKAVTKVSRLSLLQLSDSVGLDSTISPTALTVNQILQYIRAKQNASGSGVVTLYRLVNDQLEALEFAVRTPEEFLNIPLKNLHVREDVLLASIVRNNELIIPRGDTCLRMNDTVIIVTTNKGLHDLCDIFE